MRRIALVAALAAVLWTVVATPAAADSAGPSNYRSRVTGIEPNVDGVTVEVVGGDSFLVVTAAPGSVVEVPGYEGEPYLRFEADGTVRVNRTSPAFWLNDDRFGQASIPPAADAAGEPEWQTVATSGRHGWHDHRIHWMSPQPPPAVDQSASSLVMEWTLPIVVDGHEVAISGDLWWMPSLSPVPWLLASAAAGALLAWKRAAGPGVLAGGAAALVVGAAQTVASPLGWVAEALAWAPPGLAVAAGLGWVFARSESVRRNLLVVGGVLLVVWASARLSTLWMPVLPTGLPAPLERAAVATAAAAGGIALFETYRRVTGFRAAADG